MPMSTFTRTPQHPGHRAACRQLPCSACARHVHAAHTRRNALTSPPIMCPPAAPDPAPAPLRCPGVRPGPPPAPAARHRRWRRGRGALPTGCRRKGTWGDGGRTASRGSALCVRHARGRQGARRQDLGSGMAACEHRRSVRRGCGIRGPMAYARNANATGCGLAAPRHLLPITSATCWRYLLLG